MKNVLILSLMAVFALPGQAQESKALIIDVVKIGCGRTGIVYDDLASRLSEKTVSQFQMKSKGPESGRRLYFYSDSSWFLSLEFFNDEAAANDVSCLVAHGPGESSQEALDYELFEFPEWKWGTKPEDWPK